MDRLYEKKIYNVCIEQQYAELSTKVARIFPRYIRFPVTETK